MLLALRDFLRQRQTANLVEIARHLQQPVDLVRGLLAHWMQKAKVMRCAPPSGCGSRCQACPSDQAEVYQWCENSSSENNLIK